MNIYYRLIGGRYCLRFYINGASMGQLICRDVELDQVKDVFNNPGIRWFDDDAFDRDGEVVPTSGNLGEVAVDPDFVVVGADLSDKGDKDA